MPTQTVPSSGTAGIRGLWCAALTPLGENAGIDPLRFAAHVRWLLAEGVAGVVAFGTTGEGPSFSVAERIAGLEALLAAGIAPERLAVATGCAAWADAVALTRHALQSGVPRCLVLPPFYWKDLADAAVFRYYAALIEAVGDPRLRLYLYHYPELSAVPIRTGIVARLAETFPDIVAGVKDSSGDFGHTMELVQALPRLAILSGHEPHLPRLMAAGAAGTICGLANLLPDLVAALLRPDAAEAEQVRAQTFLDIVGRYPFVPSFKALQAFRTGDPAWHAPRLPLLPLPEAERVALLSALCREGFDFSRSNR